MDFTEFFISKKQAEEFAKSIFADIEPYCENHYSEYEDFLKSEMKEERGETNDIACFMKCPSQTKIHNKGEFKNE